MTRPEFLRSMLYLAAGSGKSLPAESLEVYFDCLGDLSAEVLMTAVKRVLMEHKWATFPSIAELREAAAETSAGQVKALSPAEGWAIAWRVAGKTDPEVNGSFERAIQGVPPVVVESIRVFGLLALCCGDEPIGVLRAQFLKTFEAVAGRQKRTALLPPKLHAAIEGTGRVPAALTAGIGLDTKALEGVK